MRWLAVACVAALTVGACQKKTQEAAKTGDAPAAVASAPAVPGAPPKRKPGLWSHTVATGAGVSQSMKICLDADTDAKMTVWGQAMGNQKCARNSFAPAPGGWTFESDCEMGESGRIVSKGAVTGDFHSAYTVKITSTTTNAAMAQANGVHDMTLTARWEGACPQGMAGGDVQLANGMTINMESMTAGH